MRLASVFYKGLFSSEQVQVPPHATASRHEDILGFSKTGDIVCDSIIVNSTEYKVGMLVVLSVSSQDGVTVGWIKKVIVRGRTVYFYLILRKCIRTEMRYFETSGVKSQVTVKCYTDLKSYKPLIPRGTEDFYVFFLAGRLIEDEEDALV
jgi:hypothetical protein